MSNIISFVLDNQRVTLDGAESNTTLLNYLRDSLDRKGTKEGCAEGDCGACTVVVVDIHDGELRYRSVNSCIQFMATLDGKILYTVESLKSASGELHPVQRAMLDCHGSQCGFCTPGFVMSLFALFKNVANPSRQEISDAISGNLCRCTGYRPILDAGQKMYSYSSNGEVCAADLPCGSAELQPLEQKLMSTLLSLQEEIIDKEFSHGERQFFAPTSVQNLASLVVEHPSAHLLAGGTDIGLWVTKKHMDLDKVIYLGKVAELEAIQVVGSTLQIGAMATLETALTQLSEYYPQMLDMYKRFASLPIRNAGTLVGNIANGSPIGDSMPALIALGSSLVLRKGQQTRVLPMDEFYLDYTKKDLQEGEFVESVQVPLPDGRSLSKRLGIYKITKRFEQDISAVFAAFYADIQDDKIQEIRICYGGMAATPKRASVCENRLRGKAWNQQSIDQAVTALDEDYKPLSDMRASALYRNRIAKNLLCKFYLENADPQIRWEYNTRIDVRDTGAINHTQQVES